MTLENLTWFMAGFAAALALFTMFYDWSLRTLTNKWQEEAVKAMRAAYAKGLADGVGAGDA